MDSSTAWAGRDQALTAGGPDDFQQFLDMGLNNLGDGLQFDFPDFNPSDSHQLMHDASNVMDTRMESHGGVLGQKDVIMQDQMTPMTSAPPQTSLPSTSMGIPTTSPSLVEIDAQIQFLQQQRQQQQQLEEQRQREEQRRSFYAQNNMIPPTPNSMELHGTSQFYNAEQQQQQQQAMYERFQRMKDDMAFTPLVSPAVTPLDAQFNMSDYTIPGAYFSPLNSPALHAQPDQQHRYLYQEQSASPAEASAESNVAPAATPMSLSKKGKAPSTKPSRSRTVRQSPIVKPSRRKAGSSANLSAQALSDIIEPSKSKDQAQAPESSHSGNGSTEGSENESISPEHLSDMAPPPIPQSGSVRQSPYLAGKKRGLTSGPSPATPASLMRLAKSNGQEKGSPLVTSDEAGDQVMEELELPEAAGATDERPQLARLDTTGDATPTLSSTPSATPGLQALPSPAFTRPGFPASISATQSPQLNAVNSPNGTGPSSTPSSIRKTPQLGPRNKKRPSVHVSPALRPRISPSIKPLLPGGPAGVSDDTARLLLASKSNYQNILEGTHLPGVSYPSELSTNLTSKRTSHKIAEQGRRNRINSALQEIATLLPRSPKDGKGSGSGEGNGASEASKASQAANSKASTVELAIEYIKQLRSELADANQRAEAAEMKLKATSSDGGSEASLELPCSKNLTTASTSISINTEKAETPVTTPGDSRTLKSSSSTPASAKDVMLADT